jgi:hypothetical protein
MMAGVISIFNSSAWLPKGVMVATGQKVTHPVRVTADCDRDADVMYVALGIREGEDHPRGVVLRFAQSDNSPSGVTIIGFSRHRWDGNLRSLSELIGRHLKVDAANVRLALEKAIIR